MKTKSDPLSGERIISKTQMIVLAFVLVLAGVFFFGRQFGWFGAFNGRIAIPSGKPYAEAQVIGAYEREVLANRIVRKDKTLLPKKLEILTDEKTVFAKITSSGPVKISWSEIVEGDVIWVYSVPNPVLSELAIPLQDMLKNPRERIAAGYIVVVSLKK